MWFEHETIKRVISVCITMSVSLKVSLYSFRTRLKQAFTTVLSSLSSSSSKSDLDIWTKQCTWCDLVVLSRFLLNPLTSHSASRCCLSVLFLFHFAPFCLRPLCWLAKTNHGVLDVILMLVECVHPPAGNSCCCPLYFSLLFKTPPCPWCNPVVSSCLDWPALLCPTVHPPAARACCCPPTHHQPRRQHTNCLQT